MATIRMRLTAWNVGVLVLIVCVVMLAAYAFLRAAILAQVDHALAQQASAISSTVRAITSEHDDGSGYTSAIVVDLLNHGLLVAETPNLQDDVLITAPVRVDEEGKLGATNNDPSSPWPEFDWKDLQKKVSASKDGDNAISVRAARGPIRVLIKRFDVGAKTLTVIATQPLQESLDLLATARTAALIALPIVILLALFSGYVLAQRALDPIAKMTSEARRIGARNVHDRLSVPNPHDELGQLAHTFNEVLQRVDTAMEQQRRFTADASHELRTPVAVIRAEAEVALSSDSPTVGEYRTALEAVHDGSRHLSSVVNDLFLLARADAGQALISRRLIRLDELIRVTAQNMRALAESKRIAVQVRALPVVVYRADEELLRRAITNLLDNAIKYSRGPGNVEVKLEPDGNVYKIIVTDNGPGISPADQALIFQRFFRGDSSRRHDESASGAGAGLGLAIAREIVELHNGRLELVRSDATGSSFQIVLPVIDVSSNGANPSISNR